jgi:hypothetical protein
MITSIIFGEGYKLWCSSSFNFVQSLVTFSCLRSTYSLQHRVIKHPESVSFLNVRD